LLLYTFTANKCARGLRTVCKKQGKGKCNLKGYSPWKLCSKHVGLNKNLLMEAQCVMLGLTVGLSASTNGAPGKIPFTG
jgi:hypothetical protein